jgi:hypothetical protein
MDNRRQWRRALVAAALALGLVAARGFAFVESTETQGELPREISGIWLVVNHIEFANPTPSPGEPTPAPSPAAESNRYFNVVNLLRVVHFPKAEADKRRAADVKMEEASIEKAKQLVAEEEKKAIPVQTESGDVQSDVRVVVPSVPEKRRPGTGDDVDIFLLDVAFPKSIQDEIDKAQKAQKPWNPSDKDLALLKSSWSTLKPSGRDEYSKIEWKVTAKDKYDDNYQVDETTKDAPFAIAANEEMIPKPNVPKTNILVYGVAEMKDNKMSGKHTRAMMASAPFPLPIEMRGKFDMYKVADLPPVEGAAAGAKAPSATPAKKAHPAHKK